MPHAEIQERIPNSVRKMSKPLEGIFTRGSMAIIGIPRQYIEIPVVQILPAPQRSHTRMIPAHGARTNRSVWHFDLI